MPQKFWNRASPNPFHSTHVLCLRIFTKGVMPGAAEPPALVASLVAAWQEDRSPLVNWGALVPALVRLSSDILSAAATSTAEHGRPVQVPQQQCWDLLNASEELQDSLEKLQQRYARRGQDEPRSVDGVMQADAGVINLFEGCTKSTLVEALQDIDFAAEAKGLGLAYWMCTHCERPTSENYAEHMSQKHPWIMPGDPPESLRVEVLLSIVQDTRRPAITAYSAESPVYRASNRAVRQWRQDKTAFQKWRRFAHLLDCELRLLPRFVGSVYRAVPRRVPIAVYSAGHVVTWNQPSSASEDPRVARHFLKTGGGGRPQGAIFIIQSATGRPIAEYSLHKEEKEVLFPTGTQFQVVSCADAGLKKLLEAAMRCSLADVDVYEMRELTLDSWQDLGTFMDGSQCAQNQELLALISQQHTSLQVCRNVTKRCCVPMSCLLNREDGTTALHLAVAVPNNLSCVHLVCSALRDRDALRKDGRGQTALQVAVDLGHKDAALFLIARFGGWEHLSKLQLCRALPWVCEAGDEALVKALCTAAESRDAMQNGLVQACLHNQMGCLALLIDHQADVARPNTSGWTPLAAAAQHGHLHCVEAILGHNVDVAQVTKNGKTALMSASQNGHAACVDSLVRHSANVAQATSTGWTALMFASQNGHVSCIASLMGHKADVAQANHEGWTALILASQNGHGACIDALVRHNTDVAQANNDGWTALMVASQYGHVSCIDCLVGHGADVAQTRKDGWTALMSASFHGHSSCIDCLVDYNADAAHVRTDGGTALMLASRQGHVSCIKSLVAHKADVASVKTDGHTALMFASRQGHVSCIDCLVDCNANVSQAWEDGRTALMAAAFHGHVSCIDSLVGHKADVAQAKKDGSTALMLAAQNGHVSCIVSLVGHKADVAQANSTGSTALMLATQHGHDSCIDALVRHKAKGNPRPC